LFKLRAIQLKENNINLTTSFLLVMVKSIIKQLLGIFLPRKVRNDVVRSGNRLIRGCVIAKWEKEGKPVPPPHQVKQVIIKHYQERYGCSVFVETGTYMGDMVEAQRKNFKELFSIELSVDLWKKACERFKGYTNIILLQGDSGKKLRDITLKLDKKTLFWLDGHYSAGITVKGDTNCPILAEIDAIFDGKRLNHVLLVDDARHFTGGDDYPTIDELTSYIKGKEPRYLVKVEDDVIRYTCD